MLLVVLQQAEVINGRVAMVAFALLVSQATLVPSCYECILS